MTQKLFAFVLCSTLVILKCNAQEDLQQTQMRKIYTTSGGEWIFSTGNVEGKNNVLRWSPVFNFQNLIHFDHSKNFGWFTGFNVRNVGFIYDVDDNVRKKVRHYNAGIPLGIKLGDMRGLNFFAGYEFEVSFNYRERTFQDERRTDRFSVWFSDRVNIWQHSLMAGFTLKGGTSIKFKYYLTEFYNRSFTARDENNELIRPYEDIRANIFYVSLNFNVFRDNTVIVNEWW